MIAEAVPEKKFLPCPFCGSERIKAQKKKSRYSLYYVECLTCLARGGEAEKTSTAVYWWNTRVGKWESE